MSDDLGRCDGICWYESGYGAGEIGERVAGSRGAFVVAEMVDLVLRKGLSIADAEPEANRLCETDLRLTEDQRRALTDELLARERLGINAAAGRRRAEWMEARDRSTT